MILIYFLSHLPASDLRMFQSLDFSRKLSDVQKRELKYSAVYPKYRSTRVIKILFFTKNDNMFLELFNFKLLL